MTPKRIDIVLGWLKRNERRLSSLLFVSGFITDLLTFGLLPLTTVTIMFAVYISVAALCTLAAHAATGRAGRGARTIAVLGSLIPQFILGSVLSGFLILFTKSAALTISWPFIALLIAVFIGNEVFRTYREHLVFQTVLLYFSIYAFAVFALPLFVNRLGLDVFLGSTLLAIVALVLYTFLLRIIDWQRLRTALRPILLSTAVATLLMVGSYVFGLIPPLPLALTDEGIYHHVERVEGTYRLTGEQSRVWWDVRPPVIHHLPGTPLYAYSSIFAPGDFTASVVHKWQRRDESTNRWVTQSTVAFALSGGREGGYRGYTLKYDPEPGRWRVLVETLEGQTIGDIDFRVENVPTTPQLGVVIK